MVKRTKSLESIENRPDIIKLAEKRISFFDRLERFNNQPDVKLAINEIMMIDNEAKMMIQEMNELDESIMKLSKYLSGRSLNKLKVFLNLDESRIPPDKVEKYRLIKNKVHEIGLDNPKKMLIDMEFRIKAFDTKINKIISRIDEILTVPLQYDLRMEIDDARAQVEKLKDYYQVKSEKWIGAVEKAAAEI